MDWWVIGSGSELEMVQARAWFWAWDRRPVGGGAVTRSGMAQHGILTCNLLGLPFSKSSRTTQSAKRGAG